MGSFMPAFAQNNQKYAAYIEKYRTLAIEQQKQYGIPASITMAQAILESQAGESMLAVKGKNHFGIKCGSNWSGKTINKDDDNIQDCFRKYPNVEDSYTDHSVFLKRPRYAELFDIPVQDYKAWAVGLKKLGYATDKTYDTKLIKLIEDYNLNLLAYGYLSNQKTQSEEVDYSKRYKNKNELANLVSQALNNSFDCYKLEKDAKMAEIAVALEKNFNKMLFYNDLFEDRTLPKGTFIYTKKKASECYRRRECIVAEGDSMHSISQQYGITLKSLYKLNGLTYGAIPVIGQKLFLR